MNMIFEMYFARSDWLYLVCVCEMGLTVFWWLGCGGGGKRGIKRKIKNDLQLLSWATGWVGM